MVNSPLIRGYIVPFLRILSYMEICNSFQNHSFLSTSTQQQINISIRPRTSVRVILIHSSCSDYTCYAHVHGPTRINIPRLYTLFVYLCSHSQSYIRITFSPNNALLRKIKKRKNKENNTLPSSHARRIHSYSHAS